MSGQVGFTIFTAVVFFVKEEYRCSLSHENTVTAISMVPAGIYPHGLLAIFSAWPMVD